MRTGWLGNPGIHGRGVLPIDRFQFARARRLHFELANLLLHLLAGLDRQDWRPILFHYDEPGLAPLIKAARALLGITQAELAAKAGVSLATLNNIERGTHTDPRISTIRKIRKALEESGVAFMGKESSELGVRLCSLKNRREQ